MVEDKRSRLFAAVGLDAQYAESLLKNEKLAEKLVSVIEESGITPEKGCDKSVGNLLSIVATKLPDTDFALAHRPLLCTFIAEGKIASIPQIDAALKFLEERSTMNVEEFQAFCGVGVVVTDDQIRETVRTLLSAHPDLPEKKWDLFPQLQGRLLGSVRTELPWADGKQRMSIFNEEVESLIGPRPQKGKKKSKDKKKNPQPKKDDEAPETIDKYLQGRMFPDALNTKEEFKEHVKRTGGKFMTRFPPEPNGFLHIGHAKAINFNFTLAKKKGGETYLRYDDTNPSVEKQEYITNIEENVRWLGHSPWKVTHSSDYFQELYDLAVKMIKKGKAYVCHQTQAEVKAARAYRRKHHKAVPSPYRDRSVETNLELFERMRTGKYAPGEATLRMKGDLNHPNPNMWDHIAYRIIYHPHPHVGDAWCIYPSYDFTHCIIDSLEDIDASCCTLEFENRRESYFWLLDVLDLYKPVVWEFSRLNMEYTVLSKRRLIKLVEDGHVSGWDDPRLFTINGIRRRGIPARAINNFCEKVGMSRSTNYISPLLLNQCTREVLDPTSVRGMCVLNPLKVTLRNFDENKVEEIQSLNIPGNNDSGTHSDPFSRVVYIERDDFRLEDSKSFYGLAPGKRVRLKYAFDITCEEVIKDNSGEPKELICTVHFGESTVKRGHLHWVAQPKPGQDPDVVEMRLYELLFSRKRPGKSDEEEVKGQPPEPEDEEEEEEADRKGKDKWLADINKDSLKKLDAFASRSVVERLKAWKGSPWDCAFQFERVGYFCMDADSTDKKFVLNRTLPLRESTQKKKL